MILYNKKRTLYIIHPFIFGYNNFYKIFVNCILLLQNKNNYCPQVKNNKNNLYKI